MTQSNTIPNSEEDFSEKEPWNTAPASPFSDHLEDLRAVLIKSLIAVGFAFLLCFLFHQSLFQLLEIPFSQIQAPEKFKILELTPGEITLERIGSPLTLFGPLEGISVALKVSLWGGIAIAAPFWCFFLLRFALPGLHSHERHILIPFALFSLIAVLIGGIFGYSITLPLSNAFLFQFNQPLGINLWNLERVIDYTIVLLLAHAIAFELIAVLLLLTHYRWIGPEALVNQRKKAIVIALIIGALLTPPDVLTQVLLAAPLILSYELAILYARYRARL